MANINNAYFLANDGTETKKVMGSNLANVDTELWYLVNDGTNTYKTKLFEAATEFKDSLLDKWFICNLYTLDYKVRGSKVKCLFSGEADFAYKFTQLTNDNAVYLRPHIYKGRLLISKENKPDGVLYEMHADGSTTEFTDIQFKPQWQVHFVLNQANGMDIVCFESPEYLNTVAISGTWDEGGSYSYDQYGLAGTLVPEAMYTYNNKIGIVSEYVYIGAYLSNFSRGQIASDWFDFYEPTGTLITNDENIFTPGKNIVIYPGLTGTGHNPNVDKAVYAWAPLNLTEVVTDTLEKCTFPSSWSDKNQAGTVEKYEKELITDPCIDWVPPGTGARRAHAIDQSSYITGYEVEDESYTYGEYQPDGSLLLAGIDASEIGEIIQIFNIFGGVYAVTSEGLAVFEAT